MHDIFILYFFPYIVKALSGKAVKKLVLDSLPFGKMML